MLLTVAAWVAGCSASLSVNPTPDAGGPAGDNDAGGGAFTIGGTVLGLKGGGLTLKNGGDTITVQAADPATFQFPTKLASGSAYEITVVTQPQSPNQTCIVQSGKGTVGSADVSNVLVSCTSNTFTVGGTVNGLLGSGLVLRNNGGNDLTLSAPDAGGQLTFTFSQPVAAGAAFDVTVATQPSNPVQSCTVSGGQGSVVGGNVTSVVVNCTGGGPPTYTVGGTVTGLTGTGLVLQNNGSGDLPIAANGNFAFATPLRTGATYAVTVRTQPTGPAQTCTVANGTGNVGSANVTTIAVTCSTSTFTVGGTVIGLAGTGLVLRNNGANNLSVSTNGAFVFSSPVASGQSYAVTVFTQPSNPVQNCTVTGGSGTVTNANVSNITVSCSTLGYTIGGNISGLAGTIVLRNNGTNDLTRTGDGPFVFTTPVPTGQLYNVSILSQPGGCIVTNAGGTVGSANITNVYVLCRTVTFNANGTDRTGSPQTWIVPAGVTGIRIDARGARGCPSTQGSPFGARTVGTFAVVPGQTITMRIGQMPLSYAGGGGTFVTLGSGLLLAAGGGGCAAVSSGIAQTELEGRIVTSGGTAGGVARADNGNGGAVVPSSNSGAGGGWLSTGAGAGGGAGWAQGSLGGVGESGVAGGYGGGGARTGLYGQGAGGGYSGGSCGDNPGSSSWVGCGGGGSYNAGTSQANTAGSNDGQGAVIITY